MSAAVRVQIRSLRPNRELTNDTVQLNLINQTDLLHQFIFRIERGLQTVNHNISRLQDARSALRADVKDKVPTPQAPALTSALGQRFKSMYTAVHRACRLHTQAKLL